MCCSLSRHDGYMQPRSIGDLVEKTQASTVSVYWVKSQGCQRISQEGLTHRNR